MSWSGAARAAIVGFLLLCSIASAPASADPVTSPPPTFGFVGCSNTQMSVAGYQQAGGTSFWEPTSTYNGGTIHVWASEIDVPDSPYWGAFSDALAARPTDLVWFEGCRKVEEDPAASLAEAEAVIAEIRERVPDATVYFSAINDYVEPHVCPIIGEGGPGSMRELRDQLVAESLVLPGPEMGSILSNFQVPSDGATAATNQTVSDGCHPNKSGKAYLGELLLGFFTSPPAPTFTSTPSDPSGPTATFEFVDALEDATFACAIDGGPSAPCVSPFEVAGLADGPHELSVRAVDANGVPSGATWFAWTVDAVGPAVTMALPESDALLSSPAVVSVWDPSDPNGVVRSDVWQRIGTTGSPELVQSSDATTFSITGATGTTYCYQAVAFDALGNSGEGEERCAAVPFDDGDPAIVYAGSATTVSASRAYLGTRTLLTGEGQEASLTFSGRKLGVLVLLDPASGRMDVLLDGTVVNSPDLYARRARTRYVAIQALTPGTHTLTLRWTGTKNAASTGTAVTIDGIAVIAE